MKLMLWILILLFNWILAQDNGNEVTIQPNTFPTILNKNETSNWKENLNMSFTLSIQFEAETIPSELGFYLGQSKFEYFSSNVLTRVEVRYDNGNWVKLCDKSVTTGVFTPPFATLGEHSMDIKYYYADGVAHEINNKVFVVPPRNKLYYDGKGNWVSVWTGTTSIIDRPVVIVEGFDPVNITFPDYYYGKAAMFFNRIRSLDADVMVFNFKNGGIDIAENAYIIDGFIRYITSIKQGTQKIILAGLSMGGVVARYALADAEERNQPLDVSHFLSLDAPQQGAIIPRDFQNYVKSQLNSPHPSLSSIAALQMLKYNAYDPYQNPPNFTPPNPTLSKHYLFYEHLNSLNGDGYPNNCINVGVSFAPDIPDPNLGKWLTVKIDLVADKHFYLWEDNECKVAGSYLPLSSTVACGSVFLFKWHFERYLNPTFIPYNSALDISNGESKFDIKLNSFSFNSHDIFPGDLVDPIANTIGLLPDSYNNVTFKNEINNINHINAGGDLRITDKDGKQTTVHSGASISLLTNQLYTVEILDRFRLNFGAKTENYQHHNWNMKLNDYKMKLDFKGWYNNNGIQTALLSKIEKIAVTNIIEGTVVAGSVRFKDPWFLFENNQANDFLNYKVPFTPGEGDYLYYNGVFLDQQPNPQDPKYPYYSVSALSPQEINFGSTGTHKCYFQNWSGTNVEISNPNSLETAVVFKSENSIVQANLKAVQLTNTKTTFDNSSQEKMIKTPDGTIHLVYQSLGKVWYEYCINGVWTLANNGKPLNGGVVAKDPSLSYIWTNCKTILVSYHSETGEIGIESYKAVLGNPGTSSFSFVSRLSVLEGLGVDYAYKSLPVNVCIPSGSMDGYFVLLWGESYVNAAGDAGLKYQTGFLSSTGALSWRLPEPVLLSGTLKNSEPAVAVDGYGFHLATNYNGSAIYYRKATLNSQTGLLSCNAPLSVSNGSGFAGVCNPSIAVSPSNNSSYIIGFIGKSGTNRSAVSYERIGGGFYYFKFGTGVQTQNIDIIIDPATNYYKPVLSWYDTKGAPNKFCRLNGTGSYPQYSNLTGPMVTLPGTSLTNTVGYVMKESSAPYTFTKTNSFYGISKEGENDDISVGTEGIITKNEAQLIFELGDIKLDDMNIDIKEVNDTNGLKTVQDLNKHLETNAFRITDNSKLSFSVKYGTADSLKAASELKEGGRIKYSVQLADAETGKVLGEYEKVEFSKDKISTHKTLSYIIDPSGIGSKDVILRLKCESDFEGYYTIGRIYREKSLEKSDAEEVVQAGLLEEAIIKEYALEQNYPNPFNPATTIRYSIPSGVETLHATSLRVYDILGREVAVLVNQRQAAGRYEVKFDAGSASGGLSSGMYIYRLKSGSFSDSKRMILVK